MKGAKEPQRSEMTVTRGNRRVIKMAFSRGDALRKLLVETLLDFRETSSRTARPHRVYKSECA